MKGRQDRRGKKQNSRLTATFGNRFVDRLLLSPISIYPILAYPLDSASATDVANGTARRIRTGRWASGTNGRVACVCRVDLDLFVWHVSPATRPQFLAGASTSFTSLSLNQPKKIDVTVTFKAAAAAAAAAAICDRPKLTPSPSRRTHDAPRLVVRRRL